MTNEATDAVVVRRPTNRATTRAFLRGEGDLDEVQNYKVSTMADAMRVAQERVRRMELEGSHAEGDPVDDPDPDPYGYMQELEQYFGVNILDPQWKARPEDFKWQKRLKSRARKAVVAQLFLLGHKPSFIAERCQVSESTVISDLQMIEMEWRKTYLDNAESIAARDMERLDYLLSKLSPGIERGDVKSINAAVDIIKQRSNILGYQQGVQVDIEQYIREVAAANGYDPDKAVDMATRISVSLK